MVTPYISDILVGRHVKVKIDDANDIIYVIREYPDGTSSVFLYSFVLSFDTSEVHSVSFDFEKMCKEVLDYDE